jgi:hypothetical protein
MVSFIFLTSLNVYGIVLFARPALSCRAVCIAENTVTDADVFVPESPLLFQSPALLRFKNLFGSVNPAGTEPERMGGVEHISDGETGVLHAGGAAAVAEYDDDGRSAIKGIAVSAENGGVHPGKLFHKAFVGYGCENGRLGAHAGGSELACLKHRREKCVGDGIALIALDAAACFQTFYYIIHPIASFLLFLLL